MADAEYAIIERQQLERKLETSQPDNEDARKGFALVNVLGSDAFEKEHIPGSINIPKGREEDFEKRFDRGKEIIVYCASPGCDASPKVAAELTRRGFGRVVDYEAGMSAWKEAGNPVASGGA